MERILEDTFVPVFGSCKNIASVPLCWEELLSCLNFLLTDPIFHSKKKNRNFCVFMLVCFDFTS